MASFNEDRTLALRPKDAARALGISARLLWQLTHDGEIPCVRFGNGKRNAVLYPMAQLEAWLNQRCQRGPVDRSEA